MVRRKSVALDKDANTGDMTNLIANLGAELMVTVINDLNDDKNVRSYYDRRKFNKETRRIIVIEPNSSNSKEKESHVRIKTRKCDFCFHFLLSEVP